MYSPLPSHTEKKLPPPRSRFDLAVANLVVHHIDDLDGFMDGVTGLLVDGGWVVFTEFGKVEGGRDVAGDIRAEKHLHGANVCFPLSPILPLPSWCQLS